MNFSLDSAFLKKLKKVDVRISKNVKKKLVLFSKNPKDPQLSNHVLKDEYQDYRSIDITADYRAIYKEVVIGGEKVAYFETFGTHDELYGKSKG